jgi:hypothetical protein
MLKLVVRETPDMGDTAKAPGTGPRFTLIVVCV